MIMQSLFQMSREAEKKGVPLSHRGYSYEYESLAGEAVEEGSKRAGKMIDKLINRSSKIAYKDLDGGVFSQSLGGSKDEIAKSINHMLNGTSIHFTRPPGMSDEALRQALEEAKDISPILKFENIMSYDGAKEAMAKAGAATKSQFREMLETGSASEESIQILCKAISDELMKHGKYESAKKLAGLGIKKDERFLGMLASGMVMGAGMMAVMGGIGFGLEKYKEHREHKMLYGE